MKALASCTLLFTVGLAGAVAADPLPEKNPFNKPAFMANLEEASVQLASSDIPSSELKLGATLVGGGRGLATIDGVVLAPGDEYQGYRLVAVQEGGGVLERGGERMVLQLVEEQQDDD